MALYSAGAVGVDIRPDTDNFWKILNAELHSRHPEVTVDVNTKGVARAKEQMRDLDGKTLTNVVKIDGDPSGLRAIDKAMQAQRKQWEKKPVTSRFDLDDTSFNEKIHRLSNQIKRTAGQTEAFVKKSQKSVADSLQDSLSRMRSARALYDKEATAASRRQTMLIKDEHAAYDMYAEAIENGRKRQEQLTRSQADVSKTLDWSIKKMKELREAGNIDTANWYKNSRIPELREQLKGLKADLKAVGKEIAENKKAQNKLFSADFDNKVAAQQRLIDSNTKKWEKATDAISKYSDAELMRKARLKDFNRENDRLFSGLNKILDLEEKSEKLNRRQLQQLSKLTAGQKALAEVFEDTGTSVKRLNAVQNDSRRTMDKQRKTARELTSLFDEQETQINALSAAFQKFKPMGIDKNLGKELNNTFDQLKKLRDFASRKPITAKATLDKTQWDKKYAELMYDAEKLRAKLDREHEVNVRVKVWEDNADKLEARLEKLRHTRLDIPVDWQVDQERIIASMRETAAKIKANPERRWELEADLDLQMHRAEEKLKKFEDKNDELKMDLDLETALARAHLAYFTRPRTIDIFANFKGTDLGKIFSGMTSGATGLKGVQNQFDSLVNLFDKLDKVVPKWSILGAGVTALGAGLLNLGRTAGGVGVSLVSMSKAALAAPAALAGLASAGYVGYRVFGDLKEKFDVTKTSLANLNKELGDNAWNEYGDNLYRLANDVAPSLSKGLNGIAVEEGKVLNGLIDVVRQSNEADQLPRIFENTRLAVSELNPGLQSLARAFLGLGDQSSQYLPRMASYISDVAEKWANWVDTAERTGQVSKAMEKAIEQGGYLKSSVFDLIGVFEGTLGTLAKTENGIQGFSEALEKANKAVHTIKFQETLEAWSAGAQDAQDKMRNAFKDIGDAAYSLKDTTRAVFGDAGQIVGEGITGLSRVLQQSGGGIRDFSSGVRDGFSQVFDAVGDAGPMFSDLASMVGQLSRTFGGTFASALRTVSPLISTIAKGATGVAQAFDSLPGPVKSIITLWATFGRAGKTAFESLKTGMLQNIQSTMRYQKMLSELGLSAEQASVKMGTLIKAMNQLRSGNYAGILSGAISEVNSLGMAAEANSKKLLLPGNAAKETSKDMGGLVGANGQAIASIRSAGEQAEQQSGRFGSLKTGVKNLWDAFGGWTTVAGLGISAGIAVIGNAISDYTTKAEASKQAMDKVIDGMKGIKSNAKEAADAFNDFKSETTKQWDDPSLLFGKDGGGAVTEWLVKVSGGYTSAADAAKRLGINTSTLTDAVSGNEAGYKKLVKQLEAQSKETYKASDQYGMMVEKQTDAAIAADTLLQALKKQHKEGLEKSVKEQMKYLRSLEQISDSSSALSDKLSSLATTVKANGQAFKENGELADANNAAYVRTDKAMKDVAATALLSAHQLLSYGEKNGQVEEYTQKAANSIYEAREAIVQQAQAAGMSEEAAERYADSLGLIPSDVGTTITAHSEIAQDAVDKLVQGISGLTDGEKEIVIRLREAGVVTTLDGVLSLVEQLMKGDLSERDLTLLLNAKGNARWETGEVKENLLALGMSKKAYKWLFSGEGNAEERMQKVRDELGYLNLTDEQIQWILDCIDHASGKIKDVEKNKVPAAKGVSFNIDANDDDAQVKLASYRESDGEKLAENNILVSAVDNTSEGTESAKANVFSVPHEWWSWLFGLDGTSGPSGIAKNAVESIPQQWQSILTGSGNTTLFSNIANNAVRNIPQQWLSMFTGLGNTPSFAGTARSMIGKVPTYHSTTLNAMGNALDVASNLLSTLRSIAGRTWTAFIDTISGGGGHATGGRIYGPGTSTSDSIPAMLSNGEMVLRAAAVKKIDALYGRSFLNTLNAVGSVEKAMQPSAFALNARRKSQAYATGGRVSTANGSWNIEVNPVVNVEANGNLNAGVRELNNRVDELNRQVGALAAGLPSVISENSSPWPSQRAFNRDVRGAL
ncbi:hypothetical protein MCC01990_09910 [Bifidobacteriaceae bacterium MCC01990]|jgi:hypothetical protein|nr:hypothetical protein MCC01986_16970 [Bifidobacteriaceae bacterium MCC01986]GDZ71342.1 hypothetical protein MCC01984_04090 [Bifidobacteriaceae bacterium MCC01984]GDZ77881.1 hypothetical protein MCC01990_09910 [Bifidobacteriaceae bacterium MCC01990]DAZ42804.1 MAG TPA: tail tape measure [Caudoviricetes sp.]